MSYSRGAAICRGDNYPGQQGEPAGSAFLFTSPTSGEVARVSARVRGKERSARCSSCTFALEGEGNARGAATVPDLDCWILPAVSSEIALGRRIAIRRRAPASGSRQTSNNPSPAPRAGTARVTSAPVVDHLITPITSSARIAPHLSLPPNSLSLLISLPNEQRAASE